MAGGFSLLCLVIGHPIGGLKISKELGILLLDPIPTCLDRKMRMVFNGLGDFLSG
jgi:hypothetical protein